MHRLETVFRSNFSRSLCQHLNALLYEHCAFVCCRMNDIQFEYGNCSTKKERNAIKTKTNKQTDVHLLPKNFPKTAKTTPIRNFTSVWHSHCLFDWIMLILSTTFWNAISITRMIVPFLLLSSLLPSSSSYRLNFICGFVAWSRNDSNV